MDMGKQNISGAEIFIYRTNIGGKHTYTFNAVEH